jgi:hypothetical protein
MGPNKAVDLLSQLEVLGFDNQAFWRLHHRRLNGQKDTIDAFRNYCRKIEGFKPGENNELVVKRLGFVLDCYRAADLPPGNAGAFVALAEASFKTVPPSG